MSIAVLMTCYDRVETTLRCLRTLFAQELPTDWTLDVWLVDDASPDRTGEKVKAAFPQVNVIQSPGGLYWCKGMRLAWDTAAKAKDYDAYLWLNDDVMLEPGALRGLADDVAEVGDGTIFVGAMRTESGEIAYGMGGGPDGKLRPNGRPQPAMGFMSGNFVWVPRKVFCAIGPIYGGYSHGFGDYDYGWLADRHGIARCLCSQVVGGCPQQPERYRHVAGRPFVERLKTLFDRKGFPIRDNFIYQCRRKGIGYAALSILHVVWLRVVMGRG